MKSRDSIKPTYNRLETGDRYSIEARECGRPLLKRAMPDPFVNHAVHVRGWRNALRVLLRRYTYEVIVSGDQQIVEDVIELDDDYKGAPGSTRRAEWDAQLEGSLHDFAAVLAEHADE